MMKLPELNRETDYKGLYVVDFGDAVSAGFTAEEVAELLDSERFAGVTVYKIHRAEPDGTMELKGVSNNSFQCESAMLFFADDKETAEADFDRLLKARDDSLLPGRAGLELAELDDGRLVTALIYPAEYDDEFSRWLLKADYRTAGAVEGGISAAGGYYRMSKTVLRREPLYSKDTVQSRTGESLFANAKSAVQR